MPNNPQSTIPEQFVRVGRPTKLTREIIAAYAILLGKCRCMKTVAECLDLNMSTIHKGNKRGRTEFNRMATEESASCLKSAELFVEFFRAHKKAMARSEFTIIDMIEDAGRNGHWQALAWILERRWPEKYGSQKREIGILEKEVIALSKQMATIKMRDNEIEALRVENWPRTAWTATVTATSPGRAYATVFACGERLRGSNRHSRRYGDELYTGGIRDLSALVRQYSAE